jgi:hypothetical protein
MILLAPPGAENYPISFGTQDFAAFRLDHQDPESLWAVDVSPEAAVYFLHNAGFSLMPQTTNETGVVEMTRLYHPEGYGCSVGGVAYDADEAGVVTIPSQHVGALCASHGFRPAPPAGEEPAKEREDTTSPATPVKRSSREPAAPVPPPTQQQDDGPKQTVDGGLQSTFPEDPPGTPHPDVH